MRHQVESRAEERCEYCRAPQRIYGGVFQIDHVIPESKGGVSKMENFALVCPSCNRAKSNHTQALDPESGLQGALFDPRRQE